MFGVLDRLRHGDKPAARKDSAIRIQRHPSTGHKASDAFIKFIENLQHNTIQ